MSLKSAGIILLIWILAAAIAANYEFYRQEFEGGNNSWFHFFLYYLPSFLIAGMFTPVIMYLGKRIPIEKGMYIGSFLVHLAASIVFSTVHWILEMTFRFLITGGPQYLDYIAIYFVKATFNPTFILVYWVILAVGYAFRYRRHLREQELHAMRLSQSLLSSRLNSLKSQLQPHFLFNTLQTISVLSAKGEQKKVGEMIERLGDLIRLSLDNNDNRFVTLEKELTFVDRYLGIEEVRFNDRLKVIKSIADDSRNALIPNMLLQPLVENAIKHGFSESLAGGTITINSRLQNERLLVEICDDGNGFPSEFVSSKHGGFGLRSVRERLALLYGDDYSLELRNLEPTGAGVFLNIPASPPNQIDPVVT